MKTRAALLRHQPGKWAVEEVELAPIAPSEVLVDMAYAGLCHSDDHSATGDVPAPLPYLGGHEGSGVVREVGSEVHHLKAGDHVITSFIPACGRCRWCAMGIQQLCDMGAMIMEGTRPVAGGFKMTSSDGLNVAAGGGLGTFAEVQSFDQTSLVRLDDDIPLDAAALVSCGVQTGFGSATRAGGVRPGDVVVVIGAGGIGINAVQGAKVAGAGHVVVVDPAPFKKQVAGDFGATEIFGTADAADAFVKSITNGQGADVVIVTVGVVRGEHIGQGYAMTRKAGTLVITGIGPVADDSPVPGLNAFGLAMMEKRIRGSLYGSASPREAQPQLFQLYRQGLLKLDELITRRYSLDDINQGFADMHEGINLRGVLELKR